MFYVKFIISLLQAAEYGMHEKKKKPTAAEKNPSLPLCLPTSPNTHITSTY